MSLPYVSLSSQVTVVCAWGSWLYLNIFHLVTEVMLTGEKKMVWIILLQYVKTMWKPWLMTRLWGISLNDICSTAMRLLITTTCELKKKPLKMIADKHNETDLWIAYIKSAQSLWSGWLVSFIMLLWHENDILLLSLFFFPFPLSEYQRLPSRENKHDLCSHWTFRDLSPSFP